MNKMTMKMRTEVTNHSQVRTAALCAANDTATTAKAGNTQLCHAGRSLVPQPTGTTGRASEKAHSMSNNRLTKLLRRAMQDDGLEAETAWKKLVKHVDPNTVTIVQ